MNTDLWLKVAKYKAMIRNIEGDGSKNTYTSYPITENEYAKLKIAIADKEPFTWVHDLDWNRVREVNAKRDIKEFLPITHSKPMSNLSIKCAFWVIHPIHNWTWDCKCSDKYGCLWIVFIDKLNKALWFNLSDKYDITDKIRHDYLNNIK